MPTISSGLSIVAPQKISAGFQISIAAANSISAGFEIQIPAFTPPAISSVTNPANPLLTTLIAGGSTIISNVETDPGIDVTKTPYAVGYSLQGLTSFNTCDIISWTFTLNYQGGTFDIFLKTTFPKPVEGQYITIAGMTAFITDVTEIRGSSKGNMVSGVFGNSNLLSKPLNLFANNPIIAGLLPQSNTNSNPSANWQTAAAAAGAISGVAGISLGWLAPDYAITDMFSSGQTDLLSAIRALASKVGGILHYNGNETWQVVTPAVGIGRWEGYPHCSLIKIVRRKKSKDMANESATQPRPHRGPSQYGGFDSSVIFIPLYELFAPPVEPINQFWSAEAPPSGNADPQYIDCNGHFNAALHAITPQTRIQIIVPQDQVGPSFTTADPAQWFSLSVPVVKTPSRTRFQISSSLFPIGVEGQLSLGYIADATAKNNAFRSNVDQRNERERLNAQREFGSIRFFKLYDLQIESVFFNSVPFPGNTFTFTYDDIPSRDYTVDQVTARGDASGASMSVSAGSWVEVADPYTEFDGSDLD